MSRLEAQAATRSYPVVVERVAPHQFDESITALIRLGARVIGVAGGDGSISAAANRLAGSGVSLLPLPTGTLNHFTRRLSIPSLAAAFDALDEGMLDEIPFGVADDRIFLNTATFGFYADVVRRREGMRRFLGKWPAAAVAFLIVLLRLRPVDIVLQVEGRSLRRTTPLVWVGVGWGSFPRVHRAAERRRSSDLEVVVLHTRTRLEALRLLIRLIPSLIGGARPLRNPALEIVHVRSLTIHSSSRIGGTLDGEIQRLDAPVFVGIQDRGLHVVVPAGRVRDGEGGGEQG